MTGMQERFRSYWGIEPARIRAVADAARACDADAVVVVGLNVLPYLAGVQGPLRVWYAADEWAWHHLSQVRVLRPSTWGERPGGGRQGPVRTGLRGLAGPGLGRVGGGSAGHAMGRRRPRRRCAAQRRGRRPLRPTRTPSGAEHLRLLGPARLRPQHPGAGVVLRPRLAGGAQGLSGGAVHHLRLPADAARARPGGTSKA